MRALILLAALAFTAAAGAQPVEWQLAQYDDGTFHQESGKVTAWPMDAQLFNGDRCVGIEEYGPFTCLFESQEPFSNLVTVAYDNLPQERKFMVPLDFRADEAGKVKPEKRPEPKPKEKDGTPIGLLVGGAAAVVALGGGAAVVRSRRG